MYEAMNQKMNEWMEVKFQMNFTNIFKNLESIFMYVLSMVENTF